MSESVDPVAVDMRDRPGRAHLQVARGERDTERVPFAEWPVHRSQDLGGGAAAGARQNR